jgi:hypothetical protein
MWCPIALGALLAYYGMSYGDSLIVLLFFTGLQASVEIVFSMRRSGAAISNYAFYLIHLKTAGYDYKCPWLRYVIETIVIFTLAGMIAFVFVLACKAGFKGITAGVAGN